MVSKKPGETNWISFSAETSGRSRPPLDEDRARPTVAVQRKPVVEAGNPADSTPADRGEPVDDRVLHPERPLGIGGARLARRPRRGPAGDRELERLDVVRIPETGIHLPQRQERPDHQPGADQQHQRQRDLRRPPARAASGCSAGPP